MPVVLAEVRLKQKDHHKFQTSLSYIINLELAWATQRELASKQTNKILANLINNFQLQLQVSCV